MNQSSILVGFQDLPTVWIIVIVVIVLLFLVVAVVIIGLVIFFMMRKRKKAQAAAVMSELQMSSGPAANEPVAYSEPAAEPEAAMAYDVPVPAVEPPTPIEEIRADAVEAAPASTPAPDSGSMEFDPSRTVAITRENTVTISYGYITFVSGVLAGERFEVEPDGTYIGREASLSQIVVSDPRISKRHLWIGVKDGRVMVVDQDSRNGTFLNDPKSERITEAALRNGDTVIMGESDVARFEYQT